jgi:hypothetical protein
MLRIRSRVDSVSIYSSLIRLQLTKLFFDINLVRERGLEPPRLTALAPKTSVSTIPPLAHLFRGTGVFYLNRAIFSTF